MEKIKIEIQQLKHLSDDIREIIHEYCKTNGMSTNGFAVLTGVHPNQMYLFLNKHRGLNLTTIERIAEIIS
jgi:plasmid maintenance system antidote protein VapI